MTTYNGTTTKFNKLKITSSDADALTIGGGIGCAKTLWTESLIFPPDHTTYNIFSASEGPITLTVYLTGPWSGNMTVQLTLNKIFNYVIMSWGTHYATAVTSPHLISGSISIPSGCAPANTYYGSPEGRNQLGGPCWVYDASTYTNGAVIYNGTNSTINFVKDEIAAFTASGNAGIMAGQIEWFTI